MILKKLKFKFFFFLEIPKLRVFFLQLLLFWLLIKHVIMTL